MRRFSWLIACIVALGCGPSGDGPIVVTDRADGDRTPASATCDELDPGRCFLPWPSNTFTVADPSSETGLRLAALDVSQINPRDDATSLVNADGFSRVSPLLVHFDAPLDATTLEGAMHLVLAQHDHPDRGREVPLRIDTIGIESGETLITADPREVLDANTDYVVYVDDSIRFEDGTTPEAPHAVQVALGLTDPLTPEEGAIAGYHAPTRRLLESLSVAPESLVRVWDFTTRSEEDPRRALVAVREASIAAVDAGGVEVMIDSVSPSDDPNIAMIVVGRLSGMPTFLMDHELVIGEDRLPTQLGTTDAPFRIMVPAGTGDYRFVMYGHGTGGTELDAAFDTEIASLGVAKVNVRLYGWTETDVIVTFSNLNNAIKGSFGAAAPLAEALGHAAGIQRALSSMLGDALAADTIGGMANPAAGRHPDASMPIWVGGSLGGTTGLIYGAADPDMRYGILNVPGAAWSQWVWDSATFDLIHDLIRMRYHDDIDLATALSIGQTNLDLADGAVWKDVLEQHPTAFLLQESIGDPVLPNPGTEMVAATTGARLVGGVLEPIVGIETADEVIDGTGLTQFRTPETGTFQIHGFADRDTPAGDAAREQILAFLQSAWAGESHITPPPSCPASGCDFASP